MTEEIDLQQRRSEILDNLRHHRTMIDLIGTMSRQACRPLSQADIKNIRSHREDIERLLKDLEELDQLQ